MAVDLKIEVFSVDLFRNLWHLLGFMDFVPPRLKNYDGVTYPITCIDAVADAVLCRRIIFRNGLWSNIYFDYERYSKSNHDFYLYLQNNMTEFLPYQELNIFDKLLMIGFVVLEMSTTCFMKTNKMYTYNAPMSFAMYFDTEFSSEFYDKGGWKALEIHVNSYKARVLIGNLNDMCSSFMYRNAMEIEYSMKHANQMFSEKMLSGGTACPSCYPLLHVVRTLSGTSNEVINEFQLSEGYLQLILRMFSKQELQIREKEYLKNTEFESYAEIIDIGNSHIKAQEEKSELLQAKLSYDECLKYLDDYRVRNTNEYIARLFISQENLNVADQCLFCGCNLKRVSKDKTPSDDRIERISSVIYSTIQLNHNVNGSANASFKARQCPKKKDENEALQMFFSLGLQPLTSQILVNLEKRKTNQNEPSEMHSQKTSTRKGKSKKNKTKDRSKK